MGTRECTRNSMSCTSAWPLQLATFPTTEHHYAKENGYVCTLGTMSNCLRNALKVTLNINDSIRLY